MQAMPEPEVQSATVMGTVNEVKHDSRQLNISRGPIKKWGRGPATLDFDVIDTIDLSTLSEGSEVHFTFEIRAGEFVIVELMQHGQSQMEDSAQDENGHDDSHQGMQHD